MANKRKSNPGSYEELEYIKEDINSLKSNVIALTRHLKENGERQLGDLELQAEERLRARMNDAQAAYRDNLKKLETRIRERPGQSITMAFCAGILMSYFFKR